MFTRNDQEIGRAKRWVNGTLGRVVGWKQESIQVELIIEQPGTIHDVQRAVWESYKYEYDYSADKITATVIGHYTQFPLMLAWAVTIHKSQGKTLESVRIDLGEGAFAPGQVYVALSRCRSLTDIVLTRPIKEQEVKSDERIKRFYLALSELQQGVNTSPANSKLR
jgi:ATP-dependent exoDNAse (exonuclease V) alpha subunit